MNNKKKSLELLQSIIHNAIQYGETKDNLEDYKKKLEDSIITFIDFAEIPKSNYTLNISKEKQELEYHVEEDDKTIIINVADDFAIYPGPKYISQGPNSAEEFFKSLVLPSFQKAVEQHKKLKINFDNVAGYFDSFIEYTFMTLGNHYKDNIDLVFNTLELQSDDDPDVISLALKMLNTFK